MTYQTVSRAKNPESRIQNLREAGVTLLLSILVLASVLTIAFSLTTILFIEVRSSSDLLKTEGSLYAATGVGEQAVFNLNRQACPTNNCYLTTFSNGSSLNTVPSVISTTTPIFYDKIGAYSTTTYDFCNAVATSTGCGYGKVLVNYIKTDNSQPINAYLCQFDPRYAISSNSGSNTYASLPCSVFPEQGENYYWYNSPQTLNPTTNLSASWQLTSTLQQQLILANSGPYDVYVQVETFADTAGTQPKGLPFVGKTAISINTVSGAVGRNIQVLVPNIAQTPTVSTVATSTPWRSLTTGGAGGWVSGYNVGYKFTPNKSGKITQLAINLIDSSPHLVKIYDLPSGTVLASDTLTANGSGWVVKNLATPLSIASGHSYVVAVAMSSGTGYVEAFGNKLTQGPNLTADITINEARTDGNPNANPPAAADPNNMYGLVDITFVSY